jgi:hypothetical protein
MPRLERQKAKIKNLHPLTKEKLDLSHQMGYGMHCLYDEDKAIFDLP